MKQLLAALAVVALSPFAFAQTADESNHRHQMEIRSRTQTQEVQQEHSPRMRQRIEGNFNQAREERAESRGGSYFLRGREIHRHSGFAPDDVHFRIGMHDRHWYTMRYSNIVMIDGCWYYEDAGMFWPAYGYDPNCAYPDEHIVFKF